MGCGRGNTPDGIMGRCRSRAGFTLIELLLVLVILATLAAIVVPKFAGRSEQARVTAALTQIANFETALDAFEVDNGYYPKGADGLRLLEQLLAGIIHPGARCRCARPGVRRCAKRHVLPRHAAR